MGIVNQYDALSIWYAFWLSTARAIHAVSLLHGLFGFISLSLCVLYLFVLGRRTAQPLDVAAPHATTVCHVTHAVFVRRFKSRVLRHLGFPDNRIFPSHRQL